MKKTKTFLARVINQYNPRLTSSNSLILIEIRKRGGEEQFLVEKGFASDEEINMLINDFCFVKLVDNGSYYKIDKVVPVDNFLLTAELLTNS